MSDRNRKPPLLTGFSKRNSKRENPLTNPATTIWMAIIFVALVFALMSVRKTDKLKETPEETRLRFTPYLSEKPEEKEELSPPPDYISEDDSDEPLVLNQDNLTIDYPEIDIELRPVDVELEVDHSTELDIKTEN